MRSWRVVGLLGLWLMSCVAIAKPPVPMLWKLSDADSSVYLLGSFHMLKAQDYPLDTAVEAAYADADVMVFELPPEAMQDPGVQAKFLQAAKFSDGRTLREVLPDEVEKKLAAFMGSEAAVAGSDSLQPWYLALNMSVMMVVQAGFDPNLGLDMHFMQRAQADEKPTSGLETIDDQLAALAGAPMEEQIYALDEALKPAAEMREKFDTLYQAWRDGDATAVEQEMVREMNEHTPVSARLLADERNQKWLPQVQAMLATDQNHLVIVGALHLLGDSGLVSLLQKQGLAVERVQAID
ncbi:MAG: TraB/GumN family protein [Lysobacteraceae bacterium]